MNISRYALRVIVAMRTSEKRRSFATCSTGGVMTVAAGGASVFLVEDNALIRMMIADMLVKLGHRVTAEAGHINDAAELAASAAFDVAILDVNLHGAWVLPIAELVRARGCPIILATGYDFSGLPTEIRDYPTLQKPFRVDDLANAINGVWKASPGLL